MAKARKFTAEFKAKVALAALKGDKSLAALCREDQVSDTVIARWKQQLLERCVEIFDTASPDQRHAEQVAELERVIGQLTIGNQH